MGDRVSNNYRVKEVDTRDVDDDDDVDKAASKRLTSNKRIVDLDDDGDRVGGKRGSNLNRGEEDDDDDRAGGRRMSNKRREKEFLDEEGGLDKADANYQSASALSSSCTEEISTSCSRGLASSKEPSFEERYSSKEISYKESYSKEQASSSSSFSASSKEHSSSPSSSLPLSTSKELFHTSIIDLSNSNSIKAQQPTRNSKLSSVEIEEQQQQPSQGISLCYVIFY